MDKPLKDWTLEEINECCKNTNIGACYICPLNNFCEQESVHYTPDRWNYIDGWNEVP